MITRLTDSISALRRELHEAADQLAGVEAQTAAARRRAADLVAAERGDLHERAKLTQPRGARLLADSLVLHGNAVERLGVRRLRAGERVERPFAPYMGVTCCATQAADVRALWRRLLTREANSLDGCLRGNPSTILEASDASVSREGSVLHVTPHGRHGAEAADADTVAVPRFAYAVSPRKLRNFAHWLLDCAPQVTALGAVASDARVLVPTAFNPMQRSTLALAGLPLEQMVPWDGGRLSAKRILVFESDGRLGGGRPWSALLEMRRRCAPSATPSSAARRIYVSRRDAKASRRWASNEPAVEALFARRGFDIVCPTDHSFDELVRLFGEASIVAGLNGAGLAHVTFSAPGTHVIVLVTDSLIRWHADDSGARSLWAGDYHAAPGELAALGDSPRFYAHVAAAFGQVCHSFVGADDVPTDRLSEFLDAAIAAAGRT